ncbi:MAG TPA: SMI1/KNR4 family protein [Candidatus Stackebrandtia excrementipullorum]|nr:SMI1/KNR4 family protein [Candidatus Stackebrandtia excrementipullorum]
MNDPDLIERIRHWVAQNDQSPGERASATTMEIAEAELGFSLPPLLARLYSDIGDGLFGPGGTLLPMVDGADETVLGEYNAFMGKRDGAEFYWPAGVIPVLAWGSGMYAAVDCLSDKAPVRLFEPNGISATASWANAWYTDTDNLDAWLESWMRDDAWFSENADPDRVHEPSSWAEAASRLADRKPLRDLTPEKRKPSPGKRKKK